MNAAPFPDFPAAVPNFGPNHSTSAAGSHPPAEQLPDLAPLGIITSYDDLRTIARARMDQLRITFEVRCRQRRSKRLQRQDFRTKPMQKLWPGEFLRDHGRARHQIACCRGCRAARPSSASPPASPATAAFIATLAPALCWCRVIRYSGRGLLVRLPMSIVLAAQSLARIAATPLIGFRKRPGRPRRWEGTRRLDRISTSSLFTRRRAKNTGALVAAKRGFGDLSADRPHLAAWMRGMSDLSSMQKTAPP